MTFQIPAEALAQHVAVLGKTGSGKTTTGKGIVEHLVSTGARVCVLDPIKSDWWGLTSSADGKHPGLPFHILGGPRGHVPLHATSGKAIAEIVAHGDLPLSIIDMADFAPGGQSKFFIEFAPTLLRRMRGVVHLVMEEAHLFAPKERSGVGDENMAIHWAKMLATAGRSKGIRLILLTQRTQALHNAMLGSCETMIAHRLTAPADQKPLKDWLKANVEKEIADKVGNSLASLKTGTAWVCSGEAKFFELLHFPKIKTYDNSATPAGNGDVNDDIRTAPVDVEKLRTIIGDAAKEAEANDPKALKAEIARLRASLSGDLIKNPKPNEVSNAVEKSNTHDAELEIGVRNATKAGYEAGFFEGKKNGYEIGYRTGFHAGYSEAMDAVIGHAAGLKADHPAAAKIPEPPYTILKPDDFPKSGGKYAESMHDGGKPTFTQSVKPSVKRSTNGSGALVAGADGLLAVAVRHWPARLTWGQIAALAKRKPRGGHFNASRKSLIDSGMVSEEDGAVIPTKAGFKHAGGEPERGEDLAKAYLDALPGPANKMLDMLLRRPKVTADELGAMLSMAPRGGHWNSGLAMLDRCGLIHKRGGEIMLNREALK